jgi:hypothetical protein
MHATHDDTRSTAMLISNVLFRTFLLGFGLFCLSTIPLLLLTDQIYAIHNSMIAIPRPAYNAILFEWMANMKMVLATFFLLPAIGIRWALKKS